MKLCAGQYRYLLTVYELNRTMKTVRSVDIAKKLSVTRSSVSRMLKCMSRQGLIHQDYAYSVELTEQGMEAAEKIAAEFESVNLFFVDILKLDEKSAYEQSIQFLASFPDQTVKRLAEVTKNTINKRKMQ